MASKINKFVKKVISVINNGSSPDDEAYIIGISGKWGEGKTRFLDKLDNNLDSNRYIVIRLNPWEHAQDKYSILRELLKRLQLQRENKDKLIIENLLKIDHLSSLYHDTTYTTINYTYLTVFFGLLLFFISLLILPSLLGETQVADFLRNLLGRDIIRYFRQRNLSFELLFSIWRYSILTIAIPIEYLIFQNIIFKQNATKSISAPEKFQEILKSEITKYNNLGKRIIVFVDDLDRTTPKVARQTLDVLRTFFNQKELTFIVTGDHYVLERHIGKEFLPESDLSEQLEEGRRFLKKIFNLYWRLPKPLRSETIKYIHSTIRKIGKKKDSVFRNQLTSKESKERLQDILLTYYGNNYREIERFIENIDFTFSIINAKEEKEDQIELYLNDLRENPFLVIKVLLIQDICNPLFEYFIQEPKALTEIEILFNKGDTAGVKGLIENKKIKLSSHQNTFIELLARYKERFYYTNGGSPIRDIRTFIHLTADPDFNDERGIIKDEFKNLLLTKEAARIKEELEKSSKESQKNYKDGLIETVSTQDNTGKGEILRAFFEALEGINIENTVHKLTIDSTAEIWGQITTLPANIERLTVYKSAWKWLDKVFEHYKLDKEILLEVAYKPETIDEINSFIADPSEIGKFATNTLARWFSEHFKNNQLEAIRLFSEILTKTNSTHDITAILEPITDDLFNLFFLHGEPEKNSVARIIRNSKHIRNRLRNNVLERLSTTKDDLLLDWVNNDITKPERLGEWTKSNIEESLANRIAHLQNPTELLDYIRNYSKWINEENSSSLFWKHILNAKLNDFIEIIKTIKDENLVLPSIKEDFIKERFQKLIGLISSLDESVPDQLNKKIAVLDYLNYESTINNHKLGNIHKSLSKILKNELENSDNEEIKRLVKELIDSNSNNEDNE